MTFIAKLLASKFAGPLMILFFALATVGAGFGAIQTYRLSNCQDLNVAHAATITSMAAQNIQLNTLVQERDGLIVLQNQNIEALAEARAADRAAYLKQFAAADERAKSNDTRAKQLMALKLAATDELSQCRAANTLIIDELRQ